MDMSKFKLQLIDNWRSFWKWYSTWLHVLGTAVVSVFAFVPNLPQEVQDAIPVEYRAIALAVWAVGGIVARLVQQKQEEPSA